MKKITEHITYNEAIHSFTAKKKGIDNIPDSEQLSNMYAVAERVFEPLREWVGGPIKINSFFRSKELNKAVGGARNSAHVTGSAIDIDDVYGHKTNAEMFEYIKDNLQCDVLIWEFGNKNNPNWVHVSYKTTSNRGLVLKAEKRGNTTTYIMWEQ